MRIPVNVNEIVKATKMFQDQRDTAIKIGIYIDPTAPDELISDITTSFVPLTSRARVLVEVLETGHTPKVDTSFDAVVVIAGLTDVSSPPISRARDLAIPALVVSQAGYRQDLALRFGVGILDVFTALDNPNLSVQIGDWFAESMKEKRMALAANFMSMRRGIAIELIKATAVQNGIVGGVMFVPGADMPVMTLNQIKMILQVASVYNQAMSVERAREIMVVVGSGFALRTAARQLAGLVPGFGWAVKAGIGYSGTLALGYAALEFFEDGGSVSGLTEKLKEAKSDFQARRASKKNIIIPTEEQK